MPVAQEGQNLLDRLSLEQLLRDRRELRFPGRFCSPRQQFLVEADILVARLDQLGPALYGIDGMGRHNPDDRQRGRESSGQLDRLVQRMLGVARAVDGYGDSTDFGHQGSRGWPRFRVPRQAGVTRPGSCALVIRLAGSDRKCPVRLEPPPGHPPVVRAVTLEATGPSGTVRATATIDASATFSAGSTPGPGGFGAYPKRRSGSLARPAGAGSWNTAAALPAGRRHWPDPAAGSWA